MTANTLPIFVLTPVCGMVQVTTANTNRDGTGAIAGIIWGAANGTRINAIAIKAIATTIAGMIRLYIDNGSTSFLWMEIKVPVVTASATVKTFEWYIPLKGEDALILPSGYSLRASTEKTATFNIIARGGNY